MDRARARRLADRGLALAGEVIVRGARLAADTAGRVRGREQPEPPPPRAPAAAAPAVPPQVVPLRPRAAAPPPREEHVAEEARLVETVGTDREPGADVSIAEPWPGYDEMTARDIVQRVREAGAEAAAAVQMYESAGKGRTTVLHAAERALSR